MSTHKHFDKICCAVLILSIFISTLYLRESKSETQKASYVIGYENRLFDISAVHKIDIVMDDWDSFIETCTSEEYSDCTVIIDGEAYKNVAIRAKGNTSLTQVSSYGNDRYSFKIEFDRYDSANTYYGLDKLCLNNIIQDNTYMKDYLCYQMMAEMGVASPLCSYVYITVNGSDWGLYLAVEGIEEAFLQRNYGKDYGELYKPDSQNMGGGRGNGKGFDMEEFLGDNAEAESSDIQDEQKSDDIQGGQKPDGMQGGQRPDGMQGGQRPDGMQGGQRPDGMQGGQGPDGMQDGQRPDGMQGGQRPDGMQGGQRPDGMQGGQTGLTPSEPPNGEIPDMLGQEPGANIQDEHDKRTNGSDDVLLKYSDDEFESYANIFDNAKTDITNNDKERLIESLRNLSNSKDLTNTVDIEKVIRYFVVHNFVLNFDSYTGTMIHNYYLYEKDGQMQMLPWDYNLAFGGFQSAGGASNLVNYPIDSPVSGGNTEDRPMIAWIFANEEYTELYHTYFKEFISKYFDSGKFADMIDSVKALISPYVEQDPTKFCTYEEFTTGINTLKEFCLLRAESITGQLNGTIGSTSETQDSNTLIDANELQISDMGSMNHTNEGGIAPNPPGIGNGNENGIENDMPDKQEQKFDPPRTTSEGSASSFLLLGISVGILILGLGFALIFKRRR